MSKPFEVQEAERVIAEVQAQLADTVTITISRDCAEYFAERACDNEKDCFEQFGGCASKDCHLEHACRAVLEGGR